jgi:hypothetical protein
MHASVLEHWARGDCALPDLVLIFARITRSAFRTIYGCEGRNQRLLNRNKRNWLSTEQRRMCVLRWVDTWGRYRASEQSEAHEEHGWLHGTAGRMRYKTGSGSPGGAQVRGCKAARTKRRGGLGVWPPSRRDDRLRLRLGEASRQCLGRQRPRRQR